MEAEQLPNLNKVLIDLLVDQQIPAPQEDLTPDMKSNQAIIDLLEGPLPGLQMEPIPGPELEPPP